MKILLRILFIIAFVFLCIHSVRLTYQKWLEPRSSALDPYDESVEVDIREAESLQELVERYDVAHTAVEEYEANEANPKVEYRDRSETEPYKSRLKLRAAIVDWEAKAKQVSKTRAYWFFGFAFLFLGLACYRWVNPWIGIAAFIVAFSEMIYWSSPSYFSGRSAEFERLLNNQIILAWASLVLLFIASFLTGVLHREQSSRP